MGHADPEEILGVLLCFIITEMSQLTVKMETHNTFA